MPIVRERLGKWTSKDYILPTYDGTMECVKGESIMFFGWQERKKKQYRQFYGIGVVHRVVRGNECDLIFINFGVFNDHWTRLVVAHDNHARRQTMTLKRGQVCQVYGICKYYTTEKEIKGEMKKVVELGLYAKGILGWYVPTMLDIRKMPVNDNLDIPKGDDLDKEEKMVDILDQFMSGKGEE